MQKTKLSRSTHSQATVGPSDRKSILAALEKYRTLLYEPLPAADVDEGLLQQKINALLDQLNEHLDHSELCE